MREFAGLGPGERAFIERSLNLALGRGACGRRRGVSGGAAALRAQHGAYGHLPELRATIPDLADLAGLPAFMGALVRITAQDLAQEQIASFAAYRFLYERLLGAAARPYLPAAFCCAAALPQIRPERRRLLLHSLSETAATAPGWSAAEPCFFPTQMTDAATD